MLLDTSGLLAALDSAQRRHADAAASLAAATPPLLLSPFVLAELDYLVLARVGTAARAALLEEVKGSAYLLEPFAGTDVRVAQAIIERHAGPRVSLADASIVVLASRHRVRDVLTLDERHFRVLTTRGKPFRLHPADAAGA
jgi:predicted nucleic acid-binding protein